MRLVEDPTDTSAVVLGYEDMVAAAHDAPLLKDFPVAACEGLDSRMLDRVIETKGAEAIPTFPRAPVGSSSSSPARTKLCWSMRRSA